MSVPLTGGPCVNQRLSHKTVLGTVLAFRSVNERVRMFSKIGRLFVIKTKWEAYLIIYALALGATARGSEYLTQYPGFGGKLLFLACTGAVFLAGAKILDCIRFEQAKREAELVEANLSA